MQDRPEVPHVEVAERSSGIFVDGIDLTSTGALVGTPAYMAPEHRAWEGLVTVDVRPEPTTTPVR